MESWKITIIERANRSVCFLNIVEIFFWFKLQRYESSLARPSHSVMIGVLVLVCKKMKDIAWRVCRGNSQFGLFTRWNGKLMSGESKLFSLKLTFRKVKENENLCDTIFFSNFPPVSPHALLRKWILSKRSQAPNNEIFEGWEDLLNHIHGISCFENHRVLGLHYTLPTHVCSILDIASLILCKIPKATYRRKKHNIITAIIQSFFLHIIIEEKLLTFFCPINKKQKKKHSMWPTCVTRRD